jgi:hypothetical protein
MAHPSTRPDPYCDCWLRLVPHWDAPVEEIHPGDMVRISPGESIGMVPRQLQLTHIAIQEQLEGKTADWMEKASEGQYQERS